MWARHFFARAVCLILIPILFYMAMFQLHFLILGSSGEGDAFMSSEFRQTLGRGMEDTYAGPYIVLTHMDVLVSCYYRCCPRFRNHNPASEHTRRLSTLTCS
jgi:dolichyl-phosphate-mannose--protein O-mannosyl transferase